MNLFAKQSENIIKAFELQQLRAIRLEMLAEQFNQVKHLLSDEEKKETIEQFRGLGLENPERFISDSPDTTHKSTEEVKHDMQMQLLKMQIEFHAISIDELKNRKKETEKEFYRGVKIALLAATVGAILSGGLTILLEVWKANNPPTHQTDTLLLPPIQLVRDTVIVHDTVFVK